MEKAEEEYSSLLSRARDCDSDDFSTAMGPAVILAPRWPKYILGFIAACTTLIAILVSILLLNRAPHQMLMSKMAVPPSASAVEPFAADRKAKLDCGSTPSTARAAGCVFDILSFGWLPPACVDSELTAAFLAARDWKWFTSFHGPDDNSHTHTAGDVALTPITTETMLTGEHDAWVPWELQAVHCTFLWRKMHRAMLRGWPLEEGVASYNHTLDCQEMLWRGHWLGNDVVNTRIIRGYPRCGYWAEADFEKPEGSSDY
ncbi:MAG: hypothetical protein Q9227_006111 [Pyrenula ochraceoflavens]